MTPTISTAEGPRQASVFVGCLPFSGYLFAEATWTQTAEDWLANYDRNAAAICPVLRAVYGQDATLWHRRWRLFFLATAGLFGYRGGAEWGVSHYLLRPA